MHSMYGQILEICIIRGAALDLKCGMRCVLLTVAAVLEATELAHASVRKHPRSTCTHVFALQSISNAHASKFDAQTLTSVLTPAGFSGAELANVVNEASLLAARKDAEEVTLVDLLEGLQRTKFGVDGRTGGATTSGVGARSRSGCWTGPRRPPSSPPTSGE